MYTLSRETRLQGDGFAMASDRHFSAACIEEFGFFRHIDKPLKRYDGPSFDGVYI